jgi:SAM-dependent methyltransferase
MVYYEHDLALVHARGFGQYADRCAPGVLDLLAPVRGGLVLEVGCGAGALTRHLLAAGHRVTATDASAAMVSLAGEALGPQVHLRQLALPDDPLPAAGMRAVTGGSEQRREGCTRRQEIVRIARAKASLRSR